MKVRLTFKDPDVVYDGFRAAVEDSLRALDLPEHELAVLRETRFAKLREDCSKWVEYDEYLNVEIDTEAGTATVLPVHAR